MVNPGKERTKEEELQIEEGEETVNEAVQQLAFADTVLINKIDLVEEETLEAVKKVVQTINSTARVLQCQLNKPEVDGKPGLPMEKVLDLNAFALDRALEVCDAHQLLFTGTYAAYHLNNMFVDQSNSYLCRLILTFWSLMVNWRRRRMMILRIHRLVSWLAVLHFHFAGYS